MIKAGQVDEFKRTLEANLKTRTFEDEKIVKLLEYSVKYDQPRMARKLFDSFPKIVNLDSNVIFRALKHSNTRILEIVLKYRGPKDLHVVNEDGLKPFELVVINDDNIAKLGLMALYWSRQKLDWMPAALIAAIEADSSVCFEFLLNELRELGRLDRILNTTTIFDLLNAAIAKQNTEMLKALLRSLSKKFNGFIEVNHVDNNPVIEAVKNDFYSGLRYLIKAFGSQILEIRDSIGKTPVHIAAENGNTTMVSFLAAISPELLKAVDSSGNTVLHLAFKRGENVSKFLEIVSEHHAIDFDQLNAEGKSIIDLLIDNSAISEEEIHVIYEKYLQDDLV